MRSLFVCIRCCSLFVVCCSLSIAGCLLCVDCCVFCVRFGCCSLFVSLWCVLFACFRLLFDVCYVLVVCCWLLGVPRSCVVFGALFVVCWLLLVRGCSLIVVVDGCVAFFGSCLLRVVCYFVCCVLVRCVCYVLVASCVCAYCLSFVGCWVLLGMRCVLLVVRCSLFVVRCVFRDVSWLWCWFSVVCCVLCDVVECCWLFVVYGAVFVVC